MIVFPRKKNQAIVIGDSIAVTVIETRGDGVRLGIEYPRDVVVQRGEVHAAIRKTADEPKPPW
jgi:carbon storage regulator